MPQVTLTLKRNKETNKQDLFIDYESEGDALPFEHEEDHKRLVQKILENTDLDPSEIGNIHVDRTPVGVTEDESVGETQGSREKLKNS